MGAQARRRWTCTCGLGVDAYQQGTVILDHVRASRRWRFLGAETWYGERYYLWENDLTSQRYAWQVGSYQAATL